MRLSQLLRLLGAMALSGQMVACVPVFPYEPGANTPIPSPSPEQPPAPPGEASPVRGALLLHSWSPPPEGHALWQRPSFVPMARVFMRNGDERRPEAVGRQMAETVAKHRASMARVGRIYEQYAIFPQGFGERGVSLFSNPGDALPGASNDQSPYTARGRAYWKDFSRRMLASFRAELDRRGLPHPGAAHLDLEARVPHDQIKSWLAPALRDPRARTELINGTQTLSEFRDSWRTRGGSAIDTAVSGSYWNSVQNRDLRDFSVSLTMQIADWALHDTFYSEARRVFPGIRCSNWDCLIGGTIDDPMPTRTKADMRLIGVDRLWADRSAPWFYPLMGASLQGNGSTPDDWFRATGAARSGEMDEDYGRLMLASARDQLEVMSRRRGSEHVVPWITYPGQLYKAGQFGKDARGQSYVYRTRREDIDRVMDLCIDAGVKEMILWQNDRLPVSVWNELAVLVRDAERRAGM